MFAREAKKQSEVEKMWQMDLLIKKAKRGKNGWKNVEEQFQSGRMA